MPRLFKSAAERERERKIQIRKAVNFIKREIGGCRKNQAGYLGKAKRAKKLGDKEQLAKFRSAWRRTVRTQGQLERQLLSIEGAVQLKNQAEASSKFADAMNAVSKSIASMFEKVDFAKAQAAFEEASEKAHTLEEEMNVMLDETTETLYAEEGEAGDEVISDAEFDRMLEEEVVHDESGGFDKEIAGHIKDIEKEMKSK